MPEQCATRSSQQKKEMRNKVEKDEERGSGGECNTLKQAAQTRRDGEKRKGEKERRREASIAAGIGYQAKTISRFLRDLVDGEGARRDGARANYN